MRLRREARIAGTVRLAPHRPDGPWAVQVVIPERCPATRDEGRLRNEANKSFVFSLPVPRGVRETCGARFGPSLRTASQRRVPGNLDLALQGPKNGRLGTLRRLPHATKE